MNTGVLKDRRVALAAVAGGAAYAFNGAIQATQDFGGTPTRSTRPVST